MSRASRAAALLGLLALCWLCYGRTLSYGWVWDDHAIIEHNDLLARPRTVRETVRLLAHPERGVEGAARPLFVLSLLADRRLWGAEPGGYHLTNVVLHSAVSCLVFEAALALSAPPAAAVLAGAVFAVHPVNTEAVSLPTFRPDLLAALFMLLGLLAWLRARRADGRASWAFWLSVSAAAYLLGLLSKEMAATLPALLLLAEAAFPRPGGARRARAALVLALGLFVAAAGAYFVYRHPRAGYSALRSLRAAAPAAPASPAPKAAPAAPPPQAAPAAPPPAPPPAHGRIDKPRLNREAVTPSAPQWQAFYADKRVKVMTMCGIFAEYERLLVWPAALQADRAPRLIRSARDRRLWLSLLALAGGLGLLAAAWRRGARLAAFGLSWCAISLAPVSNVVPLYNPIAERYLYVVTIGFALSAGWALEALGRALFARARKPAWGPALGALALLPLAARTVLRERDWRSDAALLGSEAAAADTTARVSYNLGVQAHERGDLAEASRRYERALELNPRSYEALVNLGGVRERQARLDEAEALYARALDLKPPSAAPYLIYGKLLRERGKKEAARDVYNRLQRDRPFEAAGFLEEAALDLDWRPVDYTVQRLKEALSRDPSVAPRAEYLMGLAYLDAADARKGPYEPAVEHLSAAAKLRPKDLQVVTNLAVALHHSGHPDQALPLFLRAKKGSPGSAPIRYDLATALADLGRNAEAEAELREAVRLAPGFAAGWYELGALHQRAGDWRGAMEFYRAGLRIVPHKLEILANLGGLEEQHGDPKVAVVLDEEAIKLAPQLGFLYNNYANALIKCKRFDEAEQTYQLAAERAREAKDLPLLHSALLNLAQTQLLLGHNAQAVSTARDILTFAPDDAVAQSLLARAQHR